MPLEGLIVYLATYQFGRFLECVINWQLINMCQVAKQKKGLFFQHQSFRFSSLQCQDLSQQETM